MFSLVCFLSSHQSPSNHIFIPVITHSCSLYKDNIYITVSSSLSISRVSSLSVIQQDGEQLRLLHSKWLTRWGSVPGSGWHAGCIWRDVQLTTWPCPNWSCYSCVLQSTNSSTDSQYSGELWFPIVFTLLLQGEL